MKNESGLEPLGFAVLLEHYQPERKESLIVMPESVEDRSALIEQRAVVVAVGPEAWKRETFPRAVPGDRVLVSKLAGYMAKGEDGKSYRFVNDQDVFAKLVGERRD